MKSADIQIGGHYIMMVSRNIVTVRVESKVEYYTVRGIKLHRWIVTNLKTGRRITVKSPQRFRSVAEKT